jgi:hypothetical protein
MAIFMAAAYTKSKPHNTCNEQRNAARRLIDQVQFSLGNRPVPIFLRARDGK